MINGKWSILQQEHDGELVRMEAIVGGGFDARGHLDGRRIVCAKKERPKCVEITECVEKNGHIEAARLMAVKTPGFMTRGKFVEWLEKRGYVSQEKAIARLIERFPDAAEVWAQ